MNVVSNGLTPPENAALSKPPITIVLVDDHALVRDGLREMLTFEDDMVVVGEAADSEQAVAEVRRHRPDVVVLDVEIPGGEPADTVAAMLETSPGTRILMLSMYDGARLLSRLLAVGISGYLLKSVTRQELVAAVRSVYSAPDRVVLSVSRQSVPRLPVHTDDAADLSPREIEILELVSRALSNSQVATQLHLSEATVKRHLRSVFVKLGAVSRIDAVNKAAARNLIAVQGDQRPG